MHVSLPIGTVPSVLPPYPLSLVPKLSKSIDMRFHWIQDRIKQLQFLVKHVAGATNVADFFTKSLPRSKHDHFAPYCAYDPVDAVA